MTISQHLALSFLLAQFDVQPLYGLGGTAAQSWQPDCCLTWLAYHFWPAGTRTAPAATRRGTACPSRSQLRSCWHYWGPEVFGLGPLRPLWFWLQITLLAHLITDVFCGRWPLQLLWPFSVPRKWGVGPSRQGHDPAWQSLPLCYSGDGTVFDNVSTVRGRSAGIAGLMVILTWRASRPSNTFHPSTRARVSHLGRP